MLPTGLLETLRRHEGLRLKPYRCTAGALTIGYGHNLDANGISRSIAEALLREDAEQAAGVAERIVANYATLTEARKVVLASMAFQLGPVSLAGFVTFRRCVESGDWAGAANAMLASRWASQTPGRARELAEMMRKG